MLPGLGVRDIVGGVGASRLRLVWWLVFVVLVCAPAAAQGSVTIGSDLTHAGTSDHNCDATGPMAGCTVIQTALAGRQLTAPFDGVIVRWRVRDYGSGTVALRVVRLLASTGGSPPWEVGFLRSSVAQQGGSAGVVTFAASPPIAVAAGDTIGVTGSADNIRGFFVGAGMGASDTIMAQNNPPDGSTQLSTNINSQNIDWLYNADIVAPPTSTAVASTCPGGSGATVTVTADPDPATGPKAVHYKIGGGPEQVTATVGVPGVATVSVPSGVHALEFWGEDQLGQQEVTHHTIMAGCAPPPLATVARISSLTETNATFAVAAASTPLTGQTARRAHRGTTFMFALDQPATVTVKIQRKTTGRRVGRACRPATSALRHTRKCTLYVAAASLTRTAHIATNKLPFTGRISGKPLPAGRYQAGFTAADSAGVSGPRTIAFTIVKR